MPTKMESFTQRARRVLSRSQEAAERYQHNSIEPEHLLLGLYQEEEGVASKVLRALGIKITQIEAHIERLQPPPTHKRDEHLGLSTNTKRVLELAVDEARRTGHQEIGTEQLLLGLTKFGAERDYPLTTNLQLQNVTVQQQVLEILSLPPVPSAPALFRPTFPAATSTVRSQVSSGTIWEDQYGYARAVRVGNWISVSGTTAADENSQVVGLDDPAEQTHYILKKIERALTQLGGSLKDVIRTRMYVVHEDHWERVALAHGEVFRDIKPVSTLILVKGLIDPKMLVEIEVDAIVGGS
ncbi:MAG: Rid family hydrolase [Anaerolineae bacterium]